MRQRREIGGYRVIAPIGAGGFSTVYRALDEAAGRDVAIKVLAENHSLQPEMRRRFIDEVKLLASVDTPAVAKIYELGETDLGQPFMVLELADRGDLRTRLEELRAGGQTLSRGDLAALARHLNEGLNALHATGIVHRDVSPGNVLIRSGPGSPHEPSLILLDAGERLLLADLGYAKDLQANSGLTVGGGTRGFAAPEQLEGVSVVDHRADIYAATALIDWAAHDSSYADDLEQFIDRGLAENPDDRFESMTEWHDALLDALGSEEDEHTGQSLAAPILIGAMVVITVAVAATAILYGQREADRVEAGDENGAGPASPSSLVVEIDGETSFEVADLVAEVEQSGPDEAAGIAEDSTPTSGPTTTNGESQEAEPTEPDTIGTTVPDTTEPPETTRPDTTDSTSPPTETTTDPIDQPTTTEDPFPTSPRAYITEPIDGGLVIGDQLRIAGTSRASGGVVEVELVIRNENTGKVWNVETGRFQDRWQPNSVPVDDPGAAETGWELVIPTDDLVPGEYLLRAWSIAADGDEDPVGESLLFTLG